MAVLDESRHVGLVPACVALCLVVVFWSSPEATSLVGLASIVVGLALLAAVATRSAGVRAYLLRGPTGASRAVTGLAAVMGTTWALVPVLTYADAGRDERFILVAALAVVMADVSRMAQVRTATWVYVGTVCCGVVAGFVWRGTAVDDALAILLLLYGAMSLLDCARARRAARRHLADRASIAAQDATIQELLLDFDETISDWVWRTDSEGRFIDSVTGEPVAALAPVEGLAMMTFQALLEQAGATTKGVEAIAQAYAARRPFRAQLVELRGAESRWMRLSGKPIVDASGRFEGYRGVGSDSTAVRTSENRIAQLANFDPLTGFANRPHFQTYAGVQCAAAAQDGLGRALLSLDLDGFRSVNDRLGHEGGDELLRQVATRLRHHVPSNAMIARIGSDEFAIWLAAATPSKAEVVAKSLVEAIGAPFDVQGMQVEIGVSIGIALAPKHALDPDELLIKADLALYRARSDTTAKVCLFTPAFETAVLERRQLHCDLKLALARGEFELHYQPLLDVASSSVRGFEALIRWRSPDRGFVSPADFIPAAEALGLIGAVGRWVLGEACRTAARWPADVCVAVNVSPPHVRSPSFFADVMTALQTSGLHPSRLEIEVTEGVFLEKSPLALDALRTLRTKGVKIALDDFGTGYSSLNYLVAFPVDKIKIDRAFVSALDSPTNRAIVDAILGLAKKLSVRVTAEGIETKEQALALKRRRCDELQGYLLSRPQPASEVPAMIAAAAAAFREAVPVYMDSPLAMALIDKSAATA